VIGISVVIVGVQISIVGEAEGGPTPTSVELTTTKSAKLVEPGRAARRLGGCLELESIKGVFERE